MLLRPLTPKSTSWCLTTADFAQIFLLGAEFTWVYAHVLGSRRPQPAPG
jgi:hypothetical protein